MKINALADLKLVAKEIDARQKREQVQRAALALAQRRKAAETNLFANAVGKVSPLPRKQHTLLPRTQVKPPPAPVAFQQAIDDRAVMVEAISDEFDGGTLLDTDDLLSFRRPGVGLDVTRKLRLGTWAIQRQLDLHGLRRDEARDRLSGFIKDAHKQGLRCVRVVHGKGLGSPGKTPVLKSRVHSWLVQKNEVLAFVQARPVDGGAGALLVLLIPG